MYVRESVGVCEREREKCVCHDSTRLLGKLLTEWGLSMPFHQSLLNCCDSFVSRLNTKTGPIITTKFPSN